MVRVRTSVDERGDGMKTPRIGGLVQHRAAVRAASSEVGPVVKKQLHHAWGEVRGEE